VDDLALSAAEAPWYDRALARFDESYIQRVFAWSWLQWAKAAVAATALFYVLALAVCLVWQPDTGLDTPATAAVLVLVAIMVGFGVVRVLYWLVVALALAFAIVIFASEGVVWAVETMRAMRRTDYRYR
jgi:cell division protein FtsW (lipid II flippase)